MKKKFLLLTKVVGLALFYMLVLVTSIFITMSALIKGEELKTPDMRGKSLSEAYKIATENGLYLKKYMGNYGKQHKPLTVINQFPTPGVKIKEKSFVQVFITSDIVEVIMPDLSGYSLRESERLIRDNNLRKRYISYMDADDVPIDFIISQSVLPGARIPSDSEIDLLVSRGKRGSSYIMPDIIGKRIELVTSHFDEIGLKISETVRVSYPGLDPGIVIKQEPTSGFPINDKARIRIEVSE